MLEKGVHEYSVRLYVNLTILSPGKETVVY